MPRHFERALFLIGDSGTGKSTQLRSLFRDWRFGTNGGASNFTQHSRNVLVQEEKVTVPSLRVTRLIR